MDRFSVTGCNSDATGENGCKPVAFSVSVSGWSDSISTASKGHRGGGFSIDVYRIAGAE